MALNQRKPTVPLDLELRVAGTDLKRLGQTASTYHNPLFCRLLLEALIWNL